MAAKLPIAVTLRRMMDMEFLKRQWIFFSLIFIVVSCVNPIDSSTDISSLEVSPNRLIVSGKNTQFKLDVTTGSTQQNTKVVNNSVTWASSNNSVATVDQNGVVTVLGLGDVSITASHLNVSDSASIEVVEIDTLEVFPENIEVSRIDESFSFSVLAKDERGRQIDHVGGLQWESSNQLVATVDSTGKVTSHDLGETTIITTFGAAKNSSQLAVTATQDVIRGIVEYEDKIYSNQGGFIGVENKFVRLAVIELLDKSNKIIDRTKTDENGYYEFSNIIPDEYALRLVSEIAESPAKGFSVRDLQASIYSFTKFSSRQTLDNPFLLTLDTPGSSAFNILDVMLSAAQFTQSELKTTVQDLAVYWQYGNELGTYFCNGFDVTSCFNGDGIYVLHQLPTLSNYGGQDTDDFDDDVLLHEFGHYLTEKYSIDDSIGGVHYIHQNDSDLRLSWSEGWGTFFPSAVKSWLNDVKPSLISSRASLTSYVDTVGDYVGLSHDIAQGEMGDGFYYASSEAAVSRILWNIKQDFGMTRIWDVFVNYFPDNDRPTSLASFWDGFVLSDMHAEQDLAQLTRIFQERRVDYSWDARENDDSMKNASTQRVGFAASESQTLFDYDQNTDVDYVRFDALAGESYRIYTYDLFNGIDTFIRLYDQAGNIIATNDDADENAYFAYDANFGFSRLRNNSTAMSSEIQFVADQTGQYFVEVTFADKNNETYDFVGHYGSYKLFISKVN